MPSSLRLIATIAGPCKITKVYRDSEWDEYRVRLYREGQHLASADHHTDDKDDAMQTARTEAHIA